MSLDDLLESIREDEFISPKAAAGHKKKIKAEKFFNLTQEIRAEGTLGGKALTPQQRKVGFKASKGGADSVDWKNFLDQVENTKASSSEGTSPNTKMLPSGGSVLEDIATDVKSILGIINSRTEAEEDASDELKQEDEKDKRKKKEEDKEKDAKKGGMKIPGFIQTAAKPITDIWGNIVKTFGILLAGWGVDKIFKWLIDPKNKKSVEELKEFITVAVPAVIKGILALTALNIGITVAKFTIMLVKGAATMLVGLKNLAGTIINMAKANPKLALALGITALAGWGISKAMSNDNEEEEVDGSSEDLKLFKSEGGAEDKSGGEDKKVKMSGGGVVPQLNVLQNFNEGGIVQQFNQGDNIAMGNNMMMDNNMTTSQPKKENNIFNFLNPLSWMGGQAQDAIGQADRGEGQFGGGLAGRMLEKRRALSEAQGFNQGGLVRPKKFNMGGKVPGAGNKDTVPAMLTPGEFVMSKGAVEKYGTSTLASMNAMGGGNNTPEIVGTIKGFNQGGIVGRIKGVAKGIKNTAKKLFNSVPDGGTPNVSILPVPSGGSGGASGGGSGGSDDNDVALFSPINHEDMQTLIVKNMYSILD